MESILLSHQFNRHTDVPEVREKPAEVRRIEQQQQKAVDWLTPGDETTLEVTLGYEQVAVDLTAWVDQQEPDPYLTQTYDFGLLEGFAAGSGLNGPFLAGALAAFVTHERDGINLFDALAATTASPVLKTRYHGFRDDADRAATAPAGLITDLGGNPNYAGHTARLTEGLDSKPAPGPQGEGEGIPSRPPIPFATPRRHQLTGACSASRYGPCSPTGVNPSRAYRRKAGLSTAT